VELADAKAKKTTDHIKLNNKRRTKKKKPPVTKEEQETWKGEWRTFERCSRQSAKKFVSPTLTPRMARMARYAVRRAVLLSSLLVPGRVIWGVKRIASLWLT
jgi:hypothetical protein